MFDINKIKFRTTIYDFGQLVVEFEEKFKDRAKKETFAFIEAGKYLHKVSVYRCSGRFNFKRAELIPFN